MNLNEEIIPLSFGDSSTPLIDYLTTPLTDDSTTPSPDYFPGWAVICVIFAVIFLLISAGVGSFFLVRRIRNRRRNHGEYRPQFEESLHAKNLPYISPPNIDGLI